MATGPQSSSELDARVASLNETLARVSEANAYAAELLVELELAREQLEARNRELVLARAAAEESARVKSTFLANMSHELRTPLNAIIGYSELLLEDSVAAQQVQLSADLSRIRTAGLHLLALVNDVLDLSKIEAGAMPMRIQTVAVVDIVRDVSALAAPLMTSNRNRFDVAEIPLGLVVQVDRLRLRQCLLNLLGNAAKFTTDGVVGLTVRPRPGFVDWVVTDSGRGIDAAHHHRLFESFVQVDDGTQPQGGTGLGLAICRGLARQMGGDVTMTSAVGLGSTFTLSLPSEPPVL